MVIVDPIRLNLIIPKCLVAALFLFTAIRIYRTKKYVLHKLFAGGFLSWGIYMLLDAFVFTYAPASPIIFRICQVGFGIQLALLIFYEFFMYNAAKVIKHGHSILENKKRMGIELGIFIVIIIALVFTARLTIKDLSGNVIPADYLPPLIGQFKVTEGFTPFSIISAIVPLVIYFWGIFNLFSVTKQTIEKVAKLRMYAIILGLILIPLGLIYFLLRGIFVQQYTFVSSLIGQLFYIFSPILIMSAIVPSYGQRKKIKKGEELNKEEMDNEPPNSQVKDGSQTKN